MRLLPVVLLLAFAAPAAAQSRAASLAAQFNKLKDVTKSKRGVTTHKYHEAVASPLAYSDLERYDGHYAADPLFMDINVSKDGRVRVLGNDGRAFEIRNGRIDDGVLTGTKLYAGGGTQLLEAVFLRRLDREDPKAAFSEMLGIGYLGDVPASWGISSPQHVFLEKL